MERNYYSIKLFENKLSLKIIKKIKKLFYHLINIFMKSFEFSYILYEIYYLLNNTIHNLKLIDEFVKLFDKYVNNTLKYNNKANIHNNNFEKYSVEFFD